MAGPQGDDGEVEAELGDEGPVVDGQGVGQAGAGELLGGRGVAEALGGVGHEAVERAEQEVQLDLVAGPQLAVQGGVHLLADAAHLEEQGQRLGGHVLPRQPGDLAAQVLEGGLADVAALGPLGVLVALPGGHQHLVAQRRLGPGAAGRQGPAGSARPVGAAQPACMARAAGPAPSPRPARPRPPPGMGRLLGTAPACTGLPWLATGGGVTGAVPNSSNAILNARQ